MPGKSAKQSLEEAFEKAVSGILQDMPVLMHGSGADISTPEAQHLVASLTVQYMSQLVDAAIESYEYSMLSSSSSAATAALQFQRPPPPPLRMEQKKRTPSEPPAVNDKKRKRKASEDLWDEPLPEPKIRSASAAANERIARENAKKDEMQKIAAKLSLDDNTDDPPPEELEDPDVWVGVAGVDLFHQQRPRNVYARRSIATPHFVFPLCHDTYVYGRIREIQTAKLTVISPVLTESVIQDVMASEGQVIRKQEQDDRKKLLALQQGPKNASTDNSGADKNNKGSPKKDGAGGNTSDPEEEEENNEEEAEIEQEEEEEASTWPGLDSILPAYRNFM